MICEKCGCHDRVTRTVRSPDKVVRIRRCIACGTQVETIETKTEKTVSNAPQRAPRKKKAKPKPKASLDLAVPNPF